VIGERIKAARLELGLNQEQLAGGTFSRSFISELERNKRRPSAESLRVIAKRLGKPLDYFLEDEHQVLYDRAVLLINQASSSIGLNDIAKAKLILEQLHKIAHELPTLPKARYHELMAWLEQAEGKVLSSVNHALTAERLFGEAEQSDKQWYCLYLGAHASYGANLYEQCIELGHRALSVISTREELQQQKRLTLNLLGSAYYAVGKITHAEQYYSDALSCSTENDLDTLIRLYHGKSICAQQQGQLGDSLAWSEKASEVSRQKQDIEIHARNEINRGLCLIRLGRLGDAIQVLNEQVDRRNHSYEVKALGYREFLLALADIEPYPVDLCQELEDKLRLLMPSVQTADSYYLLKCEWALTKSSLRRMSSQEIVPKVKALSKQFVALTHNRRAAEVLEYGAQLLELCGDLHGSYELLKAAVKLK